MNKPIYWLSYGGGVNSTALLLLMLQGKLPQYTPMRFAWSDTRDEQDETYQYIDGVIRPLLRTYGAVLETVCDQESVLARWQRYSVIGSRMLRSCSDHAKIQPLQRHVTAHTPRGYKAVQLLGIDAAESHRARPSLPTDPFPKHYPLVDLDIDRDGCVAIIKEAGLPVPRKSGCWHCPFMRVAEVLALAKERPDRFQKIVSLEAASERANPPAPGMRRTHWGNRRAIEWSARACEENSSGPLFQDEHPDPPCACYDGASSDASALDGAKERGDG